VESLTGKIALVFPGQGSQFVGMGKALYDASAAARQIFDQADEILDFPLSRLCFHGPADELEDTINAQPAILTVSIAALEALKERLAEAGHRVDPTVVAGHSLGEFSALVAAGVIDFPAGLRLVRERGRLMKEAGEVSPGGMAAIIGLDADTLNAVCDAAADGDVITVANDNCPGQTVISGEITALLRAMEMAKDRGAKRVARLGICIASHSPLLERVSSGLGEIMGRLSLGAPQIPVVANVTATAMLSVDDVRQELAHHVERPVNWTRSVMEMVNSGATTFVEVGPGQVLSGLIRRINRDVTTLSLTDLGLPADERAG
jgi:[acyl-carrier-protein] S-malonyltransferase